MVVIFGCWRGGAFSPHVRLLGTRRPCAASQMSGIVSVIIILRLSCSSMLMTSFPIGLSFIVVDD